ncbi:hypothetical protein [Neorhodopirellula pilleata]|uniref:Uncharacterized protein n=1 Tax=Neorhodopirellula pilleata TaxID=2714738 RepID=A0A5C5ZPF2_9BACT|nr:hypothetical protein [Neorhodopirellula pilleata]TWT89364.1 hypothetical protein Pla100_55270 [Neorhodopirellula pilleata]
MTIEDPHHALVDRIQRILQRLGFDDCDVLDIHEGRAKLLASEMDRDDQCLIQAAIRVIPGVQSVVFVDHSEQENKL